MGFMSDEEIALIKESLGLDRPLVVQYGAWMRDVLTGSFGKTMFASKSPIIDIIRSRGVISAEIGIIGVAMSWIIGLPVGILSAIRPNSVGDMFTSFRTVLLLAIPGFWLALLILLSTINLWGYGPPSSACICGTPRGKIFRLLSSLLQ